MKGNLCSICEKCHDKVHHGNLTITGSTTTASSTNTTITDKLIELANGASGSASGDVGLVLERGDDANVFIGWDEDFTNIIFDKAVEASQDNIELYSITKDIKDNFTKDEILNIFVYLWKVILSDGIIDDYESGLMRNLTGLFHLTGKEVAETKATAESLIKKN